MIMNSKYILMSADETVHVITDDLAYLLQVASDMVKDGAFSAADLAVYTHTHTVTVPEIRVTLKEAK